MSDTVITTAYTTVTAGNNLYSESPQLNIISKLKTHQSLATLHSTGGVCASTMARQNTKHLESKSNEVQWQSAY